MCLKGFLMPRLGVLSHSILESGRVLLAPSLHRESTDSLIEKSPIQITRRAHYMCSPMINIVIFQYRDIKSINS